MLETTVEHNDVQEILKVWEAMSPYSSILKHLFKKSHIYNIVVIYMSFVTVS